MITDLDYAPEFGLSGIEDMRAYKRSVKVKHYNMLLNNITDDFHEFLLDRFTFNKINTYLKK